MALVALLGGCSAEGASGPSDQPESVDQSAQELYANTDFFWSGAPPIIPVCWNNPAQASSTRRGWIQDTMDRNWARYGRVNFTGWGTCPAGAFNGVRIQIDNRGGAATTGFFDNGSNNNGSSRFRSGRFVSGLATGVTLNLGFGGLCSNNGAYCESSSTCGAGVCQGISPSCGGANIEFCARALAIHEFGHVIGFWHEEERNDYAPAGDRNGNGLADTTESFCNKQAEDWDGNGIRNNYQPQYYGQYDVNSVMSYCGQPIVSMWKKDVGAGDTMAVQRAYGRRIAGSLVSPRAKCAAARYAVGAGDPGFVWDCDEALDDQEWKSPVSSGDDRYLQLTGSGASLCLAADSAANGSNVNLKTCSTSRDWVFEQMYIRGLGGLCLDLPNGNVTNGTQLQMWQCGAAGGVNQRFSLTGAGAIKFGDLSSTKCLRNVSNALVIWDCGVSGQTFSPQSSGALSNGGLCVDVANVNDAQYLSGQGLPNNGNLVNLFTCNSALNQRWNLSGTIRYGANHNLCLARNGADSAGTFLKLGTCTGDSTQEWDYYFRP
jgi:hypothetical protein